MLCSAVPPEKKQELLRVATGDHQHRTKESMAGMGIDRHLFALYVVSRGIPFPTPSNPCSFCPSGRILSELVL